MTSSKDLFERSLQVAPGGVHSPVRAFKSVGGTPIFMERAEGAYIYSIEGRRYIDFCQSFGPLLLGHRDPDVEESVHEAVQKGWSFGTAEPYSLELAEWILARIPWVEKLRFVNSGTEAVMSALRVARAATGRSRVLKFEGCYHGHFDALLVKAGSGLAGVAASDSAGVPEAIAKETLVCPLNDIEAFNRIIDEHGSDIAVVAIEPLPANYGLLVQRTEFLNEVARRTRENGSLLLFDEVISGFRVAFGGMAEETGIQPDLVCYGKVIGGGFPVGCYGGRAEFMDLVAPAGPVYQAGTLSANPIGMRAGLTTLKKVEKQDVVRTLKRRAEQFASELRSAFAAARLPLKVVQKSSLFWIHSGQEDEPRALGQLPSDHAQKFAPLFHKCLEKGLYLAPSGFEVGFLSLAHTPEILEEAAQIIAEAAKEVHA